MSRQPHRVSSGQRVSEKNHTKVSTHQIPSNQPTGPMLTSTQRNRLMLFHVKSQSNCHSITMTKSHNVKNGEKSGTYCDKAVLTVTKSYDVKNGEKSGTYCDKAVLTVTKRYLL